MTDDTNRLWELLPVVHRQRDLELGGPLRDLLGVIAEQVDAVEATADQLYENWFIETCDDWVVPYIGALVGYRPVQDPRRAGGEADGLRNRFLVPRSEVANTIRYRRRKGTLFVLQQLALDVAGWPARVVEFDRLVAATGSLVSARAAVPATVDVRRLRPLLHLNSPFDSLPHTVEIRRPSSHRRPGRYNLSSLVLFAARTLSLPVTRGDANCIEEKGRNCFTFSPLGSDAPLYTRPNREAGRRRFLKERDLPVPIRRRVLEERRIVDGVPVRRISERYYGSDRSFAIWAPGWADVGTGMIPAARIVPADLTNWRYRPRPGTVAVDPMLGRILFPPGQPPKAVSVSYHYGATAEIGGGEYNRPVGDDAGATVYTLARYGGEMHGSLADALDRWAKEKPRRAVIEFAGSEIYDEDELRITLGADQELTIRARPGTRPLLRLLDWQGGGEDALRVEGAPGSRLVLEGLLVSGRGLRLSGPLAGLTIRHCTLVPGWDLFREGQPRHADGPSIVIDPSVGRLAIEHSIVGPLRIVQDPACDEPVAVTLSDSVLDAGGPDAEAVQSQAALVAYARMTLRRVTAFGRISVHAIDVAENSIVSGRVTVARRQHGCVRFCYIPPGSRTPSRYRCQPDLALHGMVGAGRSAVELRVEPAFLSMRYGHPQYARLATGCADEIRRGADDEAELGVFHDLFEAQREDALRARLREFVPASVDTGLVLLD